MTTETVTGYRVTCSLCPEYTEELETFTDAQDVGDSHGMTAHGDIFSRSIEVEPIR